MMGEPEDQPIDVQRLRSLMEYASKTHYRTNTNTGENDMIMKTCLKLFSKDYKYSLINNQSGELCGHYPPQIVVLEYQIAGPAPANEKMESMHDMRQIKELITRARLARCRSRFAVPVIMCEGKHILRGATISGGAEMYGRQVYDMLISGGGGGASLIGGGDATPSTSGSTNQESDNNSNDWLMFTKVRGADIKLLKMFQVGYIFDLMVEKKKVKFGMNVTSSEKVDKENRYSEFNIVTMPYPGCEFFRTWKDCGYTTEGIVFDWSQGDVNVLLDLPVKPSPPRGIIWSRYKHWDLACLTQNYLRLLLHYLREGDSGMLVHCISGWDRTPLFISLLRLSLWAERLIHQSLSAIEILYLTVAYDWFLFGHSFPDRLKSGEDVFLFCFNFLKYITDDDFNINSRPRHRKVSSRTDSECQFDGVLLDVDGGPQGSGSSCRGSNTSISSIGSLNSTRSSIDHPAISLSTTGGGSGVCFNIGSVEEDAFVNGLQTSSTTLRTSICSNNQSIGSISVGGLSSSPAYISSSSLQQSGSGACSGRGAVLHSNNGSVGSSHSVHCGTVPGISGTTGSSPMAVPRTVQRVPSDVRSVAASCGSWQMIATPESYQARYGTPGSIPSSTTSDQRSSSGSESREHCYTDLQSTRRQRLDAVRWYFLSAYRSAVDPSVPSFEPCYTDFSHHSPSSASPSSFPTSGAGGGGASGFTSMFENFAEKVGIRSPSAKSTLV